MWWNSDQPNPTEGLNPENHGWKLHEGHMVSVWFDGPSFPDISARRQEETNDDRLGDSSNDNDSDISEYGEIWSDDSETYE